jgi:translation initiation factor 2 subunit 2
MSQFDLSIRKKRRKRQQPAEAVPEQHTYEMLLNRIQGMLLSNNAKSTEKTRIMLKPPQLTKLGTRKTVWNNFQETCTVLRRTPDHVRSFIVAELGTEGTLDGNEHLVLRGKFVPKYIESLLRKYIVQYATCKTCRSANTTLIKDSVSRLHFMHCQDCSSSRSVAPIQQGFHAQTRADRKAQRNAIA